MKHPKREREKLIYSRPIMPFRSLRSRRDELVKVIAYKDIPGDVFNAAIGLIISFAFGAISFFAIATETISIRGDAYAFSEHPLMYLMLLIGAIAFTIVSFCYGVLFSYFLIVSKFVRS